MGHKVLLAQLVVEHQPTMCKILSLGKKFLYVFPVCDVCTECILAWMLGKRDKRKQSKAASVVGFLHTCLVFILLQEMMDKPKHKCINGNRQTDGDSSYKSIVCCPKNMLFYDLKVRQNNYNIAHGTPLYTRNCTESFTGIISTNLSPPPFSRYCHRSLYKRRNSMSQETKK